VTTRAQNTFCLRSRLIEIGQAYVRGTVAVLEMCFFVLLGTLATRGVAIADSRQAYQNVPGEQLITSMDLIETRDISGVRVSPDGRTVVVRVATPDVATNSVRLTWYAISLESGGVSVIADGGQPIWSTVGYIQTESPTWSIDSKSIYFRALHDEEVQLWRAWVADKRVEQVSADPADVERFVVDESHNRIFYTTGTTREEIKHAEEEEYESGVVLDPTVQVEESLLHNWPYHGRMATLRRDGTHDYYVLMGNREPAIRVLGADGKAAHDADSEERRYFQEAAVHSQAMSGGSVVKLERAENSRHVAFLQRVGERKMPPEYQLKWSDSGDTKDAVECGDPVCRSTRLSQPYWRADGREALFVTWRASGESRLYAWNVQDNSIRQVAASTGLLGVGAGVDRFGSLGCPVAKNKAICITEETDQPPRLEAIDVDSGTRSVLLDPNTTLRAKPFPTVHRMKWRNRWGREETGVLVVPRTTKSKGRLPLMITSYHCEGFLRGGSGEDVPEFVLAELGFAALCVNFNLDLLSLPYPGKGVANGQPTHLQDMTDAWESGVQELDRQRLIDPRRVGVSGLSFGAEATLYAVSHSSAFAAAASGGPPFMDPINYYIFATKGQLAKEHFKFRNMPDPSDDVEHVYAQESPALNTEKITAPVLIQSSENEFRAGIQFYVNMVAADRPLEFIVFPEEGHHKMQPKHRLVVNERNIQWFRFWLADWESQDPRLAQQYKRWHALRDKRSAIAITNR
jgi:dipeptidyl aminopeptidase/acylaminoacyl peptidase